MKKYVLLALCLFTLSCTSIRMKYESTVEVDGQANTFTYVNTYPVGGAYSSLCYISAIAFGGSCWYYLVMPTVLQKSMIIEEAQNKLATKMVGKSYQEDFTRVSKVSFDEGPEELNLTPQSRAFNTH
jgi:hypothetical protein